MTNPYARYTALRARITEKEAKLTQLRTEAENEALRVFREVCFKEGDVVQYRDRAKYRVSKIDLWKPPFSTEIIAFLFYGHKQLKTELNFSKNPVYFAFLKEEEMEYITIISRAE